MTWDAIQAQAAVSTVDSGRDPAFVPVVGGMSGSAAAGGVSDFAHLVRQGLGEVNGQLIASQVNLQRLATGDVQNLHQVMMGLEETKLSFQLFLQVRSRMLEAYQDLMKMQI